VSTWFDRYRGESQGRVVGGSGGLPASLTCANSETYDFSGSGDESLFVEVDGDQAQTITFPDSAFAVPAAATAAEVVARINALLTGATAEVTFGGEVSITTRSKGEDATLRVIGGGANAILGFSTDEVTGTEEGYIFVLGSTGDAEVVSLQDGDYTEIKQLVDLTNVDVVQATIDTIGAAVQQALEPNQLLVEADTLWLFPMDREIEGATNAVLSGFDLLGVGGINPVEETYSAPGWRTMCRDFPIGATAQLVGENTPPFMSAPLTEYTIEFWMNFDMASIPSSWGVNPEIMRCSDGVDGIGITLSGAVGPGARSWVISVTHWNNPAIQGNGFPSYILDPTVPAMLGWHFYSIVWDFSLPGVNRLTLYVDGVPVSNSFAVPTTNPAPPPPGQEFSLGSPLLWGQLDQARMSDTAHAAFKVLQDYQTCVNVPTAHDYGWRMQILIDGAVYVERFIPATEIRRWTDFRAPTHLLSGNHEVAFRMLLEEI